MIYTTCKLRQKSFAYCSKEPTHSAAHGHGCTAARFMHERLAVSQSVDGIFLQNSPISSGKKPCVFLKKPRAEAFRKRAYIFRNVFHNWKPYVIRTRANVYLIWNFFFWLWCRHTASAPITSGQSDVVCSNKEVQKRLAQIERHSRNWHMEPIMFVGIVACACDQHALAFKILFFRSFVRSCFTFFLLYVCVQHREIQTAATKGLPSDYFR